jgi:hypothetical protein
MEALDTSGSSSSIEGSLSASTQTAVCPRPAGRRVRGFSASLRGRPLGFVDVEGGLDCLDVLEGLDGLGDLAGLG